MRDAAHSRLFRTEMIDPVSTKLSFEAYHHDIIVGRVVATNGNDLMCVASVTWRKQGSVNRTFVVSP